MWAIIFTLILKWRGRCSRVSLGIVGFRHLHLPTPLFPTKCPSKDSLPSSITSHLTIFHFLVTKILMIRFQSFRVHKTDGGFNSYQWENRCLLSYSSQLLYLHFWQQPSENTIAWLVAHTLPTVHDLSPPQTWIRISKNKACVLF